MLSSPICVIDYYGITTPTFDDVLDWLQQQYQAIYGADIDIAADTQDGQWIATISQALHDANQTIMHTYASYSPTFAVGGGLSSVVKINGIRRHIASTGTVLIEAVGVAGTDISGGVVSDELQAQTEWQLPASGVIIPPSGVIQVTAACLVAGDQRAGIGSITRIVTPIPGWQTVTNPAAAVPGLPVESDADLRRRQTYSVANPSQTIVVGIQGAIASVPGVARAFVYENPTSATDANGIPPFSMSAVVEGGDAQAVAEAIALRKTPGSPTFGGTTVLYYDLRGIPASIHFFELALVPIRVEIVLTALPGFTEAIANALVAQVIEYLTALPIGYDSYITKLIAACEVVAVYGSEFPPALTYEITSVKQARGSDPVAAVDIPIAFNEACFCELDLIVLTVNPSSRRSGRGNEWPGSLITPPARS